MISMVNAVDLTKICSYIAIDLNLTLDGVWMEHFSMNSVCATMLI